MDAEAKKLHIIEEVLKVNNDTVLVELENVLSKSNTSNPRKAFLSFTTQLSPEELSEFEKNIENGCEQINEDDWK